VTHAIDRGIYFDGPGAHFFQQSSQLVLIHST
jgi:hypothetical protein